MWRPPFLVEHGEDVRKWQGRPASFSLQDIYADVCTGNHTRASFARFVQHAFVMTCDGSQRAALRECRADGGALIVPAEAASSAAAEGSECCECSECCNSAEPYECSICCDTFADAPTSLGAGSGAAAHLVLPPCGNATHAACTSCIRTWATNWYQHPIHEGQPFVTCLHHESCDAVWRDIHVFRPLLCDADFGRLRQLHIDAHKQDTIDAPCPNCPHHGSVPVTYLQQNPHVMVSCSSCNTRFCFYCLTAQCADAPPCMCRHTNRTGHATFNTFFTGTDGAYLRNNQLQADRCAAELEDIIFGDAFLARKCDKCRAPLHKASACNAIDHCGRRRCFVCGEQPLPGHKVLMDHWIGMPGGKCPQYDNDAYWDIFVQTFQCTEGECYDEGRDCCVPEHQQGILDMHRHRKLRHFMTAIESVPPRVQDAIMTTLCTEERPLPQREILFRFLADAQELALMLD